jgi:hypothetical protein
MNWFQLYTATGVVGHEYRGHSLRATGATIMAQAGHTQPEIMRAGRWASDAFLIYLRDHPEVVGRLLVGSLPPVVVSDAALEAGAMDAESTDSRFLDSPRAADFDQKFTH